MWLWHLGWGVEWNDVYVQVLDSELFVTAIAEEVDGVEVPEPVCESCYRCCAVASPCHRPLLMHCGAIAHVHTL